VRAPAPAFPLVLALPDGGARYSHLDGERPVYVRDGVILDVDVRIPADIVDRWFWSGSFLKLNTAPGECGYSIDPRTFGLTETFAIARRQVEHERARVGEIVQLAIDWREAA
jgi:hypothetical protein